MCGGPAWKREVVPDHKFDFVDVRDFTDNGFAMRMKYLWVYIVVLKSFLVYVSDIFTAITMIATEQLSTQILPSNCAGVDGCVSIPFNVVKWLFVGCIIFSFLLLAYETRKTKKIIASRDISYAFTNVLANNYYSIRSYDHFCFFDHISNSTKKKDDFVFFIFFTFKSWKRLLLADGPRQVINALTLWSIYLSKQKEPGNWYDVTKYFRGQKLSISALTVTTFFTVLVFAGSMLLLIAAAIFYIPLLCYIQGNLKEYVCHKVDKRISQIIKRRNKERLAKAAELARKEAMGDYSHLKNKKGELIAQPLPQPTLPNLSVDDDVTDTSSMGTRGPPPSTYTQDYYYASDYKSEVDYPPMPAYHQAYGVSSQTTLAEHPGMYEDDYEGTAHLTGAAAPFGQQLQVDHRPGSAQPSPASAYSNPHSYFVPDPQDVYHGRTDSDRRTPAPSLPPQQGMFGEPLSDLAYDDGYATPAYTAQADQAPMQGRNDGYDSYGRGVHHQGDVEQARRWHGGSGYT